MLDRLTQAGILLTLLVVNIFFTNVTVAQAETVKVLSNSTHAAGSIRSTINQLLGTGHLENDVIVHRTFLDNSYRGNANTALNTTATYYETVNTNATNSAPYQIYTSSFSAFRGDTVSVYNEFDNVDLIHNIASTFNNNSAPPVFHTAVGGTAFGSKTGVEWTIDGTEINLSGPTPTLSEVTARGAGLLASVRYDHPNWNWFDVKAAIRQTASNWDTGYDDSIYGFGNAFYASSTALTDNELLLQPPVAEVATTSFGQISFTLYPFKQTRRAKEVLFQFTSNPGFQADELSLTDITSTYGGTKIMEYTQTTASADITPIYTPFTDAYFVWFTADDLDDNVANFSRIDTYSLLGPYSQDEIHFSSNFNLTYPLNNKITSPLPTFSWTEPTSYLGVTKYQLYVDGVLEKDNITGTSTTLTTPLLEGAHTWHIVAVNGGGATSSSLITRSIEVLNGYSVSKAWYVDNVLGDDSNDGSEASPWATIAKASTVAQPGNEVIIIKNDGVPYREEVFAPQGNIRDGNITLRGVDSFNKPEIWGSENVSQSVVGDWTLYTDGATSTYQRTMSAANAFATGQSIDSLVASEWSDSDKTLLNEGEWTTDSGVHYYRLKTDEDINTLHMEVSKNNLNLLCSSRNTFKDITVRYANINGVYMGIGCRGERLEVYDNGGNGVFISGGNSSLKTGATLRHSIVSGNYSNGIFGQLVNYARIYNNVLSDNGTGLYLNLWAHNSIVRNNIFTDNTKNIDLNFSSITNNFLSSNNNWHSGTVDSTWTDTYGGTNNRASTSPLLTDTSQRNFRPQKLSPSIDSGINIGLTTDVYGNPIYGTPDIGAVEYQPPYQIGSDQINTSGSVRLYADGKYRYLNATSSSDYAELSATPENGFGAGDYGEYMNLTINSWEPDSEDAVKSWTASSSYATSTVFSIPDLTPKTSYDIKIDGLLTANINGSTCTVGACVTDNNGTLTFTYTGGWSTHTFTIEQSEVPKPATSSGGSSSRKKTSTAETDVVADKIVTVTSELEIDETSREQLLSKISELQELIKTLTTQLSAKQEPAVSYKFSKKLKVGDENDDVLMLQKKLNQLGFTIFDSGPGSPGNETLYYGPRTTTALKRFQCHYDIVCSGTPDTTGYGNFGPLTRTMMNQL